MKFAVRPLRGPGGYQCLWEVLVLRRKSAAASSLSGPRRDAAAVVLFFLFLFCSMHIWTEPFAVLAALAALAFSLGRIPLRLGRERFCVPVLGLLAFMALCGAAAIYSPFGGSAVRDFRGLLAAFALAALVLLRVEKRHVRGLLWGFAVICAVVGLLCTSFACEGPLWNGFSALMAFFGQGSYAAEIENTAGRVNGIYNDANVSASILALGTLVSLYLVQTGENWKKRLAACVLTGVSAMGILFSLSRGAILCFALALLVWLAVTEKTARLRLFLLMAAAAAVTAVMSMLAMPAVAPGAVLPNLLAVISGGLIYLLDWAVCERLARLFAGRGRLAAALAAALAVLLLVYALAATRITGPYTLDGSGSLSRIVSLSPGSYTLSGDWDGEIHALVISRSKLDVMQSQGRFDTLYSGPLEAAAFTVTGEEYELTVQLSGAAGSQLRRVTFSDGTELPLGYPLLPGAAADRLQGNFFAGNSFLLRVQFDRDAWTIFLRSPLVGHGLGSTDNLYPTVQPFYYTSRFAHNHLLQVMADMGLVGLAAFVVFLGGVLWLLARRLKKDRDPLAALLLACWVMMNTHSLMEVNFSVQAYLCASYVLLLLPVVLYGEPLSEKAVKAGGAAVCAGMWLYLAVFGGLLGLRQSVRHASDTLRASSMEQLLSALDGYAKRDVFDPDPYRLEYVATALQEGSGRYNAQMVEYVDRILRSGSYPACAGLVEYYYLPAGDLRGLFACSRACLTQRASYQEVWNEQVAFYRGEVLPAAGEARMAEFTEGVLAVRDLLEEVNGQEGRMEKIALTAENQAFVDAVAAGASYKALMELAG